MEFKVSLTLRENGVYLMPAAKWAAQIESNPSVQTMGLSLAQVKLILTRLQTEIVEQQITRLSNRQRQCPHCGQTRKLKDVHQIHYCSLFGEVAMRIPRCGLVPAALYVRSQMLANASAGFRLSWSSFKASWPPPFLTPSLLSS